MNNKRTSIRVFVVLFIISLLTISIPFGNNKAAAGGGDEPEIFLDQDWTMDMELSEVADASYIGEYDRDQAGELPARLGDVNGDGYDDFYTTTGYNEQGPHNGGKLYFLFGHGSTWKTNVNLSNANASIKICGTGDPDFICDGIGDINGDGIDDLAISLPMNDTAGIDSGQYFLFFGKRTGWKLNATLEDANASYLGENEEDRLGCAILPVGDLNDDGIDDLVISSVCNSEGGNIAGKTYIIFGRYDNWQMGMDVSEANASFIGESHSDQSGWFFMGPGDVNDDGIDDLVISANSIHNNGGIPGRSYLIFGRTSGWLKNVPLTDANATFLEEKYGDLFGLCSKVGDINGDDIDDLFFSARFADMGKGKSYIFLGKKMGWKKGTDLGEADIVITGERNGDQSKCISFGGDVNNDGYSDLTIGAFGSDEGGENAGQTYMFLGREEWPAEMDLSMADASFIGEEEGDFSGFACTVMGDANKDGYEDILISAWGSDGGGNKKGKMYLILGSDGISSKPSITVNGPFIQSQLDEGYLEGELTIHWEAEDAEDLSDLNISIYYRMDQGKWITIEEGLENSGAFIWNTTDPRIPDAAGYSLMVTAKDSSGKRTADIIGFTFGIDNPDPPTIDIMQPGNSTAISGIVSIIWTASDDEDLSGDLLVSIMISNDQGDSYLSVEEGVRNLGYYYLNSWEYPDGQDYWLKILVRDTSGFEDEDIVIGLEFVNEPNIEILLPEEGEVLGGTYKVRWFSSDPTDPEEELTIDIWLLDNSTGSRTLLEQGLSNIGSYYFETSGYPEGDSYRLEIMITDTNGKNSTAVSPYFSIFNNDPPEVIFTGPEENLTYSGDIELTWDSFDEETPDDLLFSLFYQFENDGPWKTLALNREDNGTIEIDTLSFMEGDGEYTFQVKVKDAHGIVSEASFLSINIYNPDAPIINWIEGPEEPVRDGTAHIVWDVRDPDIGEDEDLKVWISISHDNETWDLAAEGIPNEDEYEMDVSGLEDGEYFLKIMVSDCQEGNYNRSSELVMDGNVEVNNVNDPPSIELLEGPTSDMEYSGEITFTWTASDPDGDRLTYSLYYRTAGEEEWTIIQGAQGLDVTSFTWNISEMEEGDYQVKIVARDDFMDSEETEITTMEFHIKPVEMDIGDEEREVTVNQGLLIGIIAGSVILIIIIVWILFLNARKKDRIEETIKRDSMARTMENEE